MSVHCGVVFGSKGSLEFQRAWGSRDDVHVPGVERRLFTLRGNFSTNAVVHSPWVGVVLTANAVRHAQDQAKRRQACGYQLDYRLGRYEEYRWRQKREIARRGRFAM